MIASSVFNATITFLTLPFTFLSLGIFIFVSLHRKEIKYSSRFQFQFQNDNKNTDIKLMVNAFMLILLAVEIIHNILVTFSFILNSFIPNSKPPNLWHTNCTIDNSDILTLLHKQGWILLSPIDISYSSSSLLLSTLTLLLRVLKRRYINAPYHRIISNSILFITFRFLLLLTLFSSPYTYYFALVVKFTCIFDLFLYMYHSHSFYTLLKRRRLEAQWHLDSCDLRKQSRVCNQYFYTGILCAVIFAIFTAEHFLLCINGFLDIILQNTCVLSHYTLGYIPELTFDPRTQTVLSHLHTCLFITELTLGILHQVLTSTAYSIVLISYCIHFWKINFFPFCINGNTRVCMQEYNRTLYRHTVGFGW